MTSAAVNNTAAGKAPLNNKTLGIGMVAFAVIEAVVTFFLVMKPLFINPVFNQCKAYNEEGKACIVKLFGKIRLCSLGEAWAVAVAAVRIEGKLGNN